jgi:hypothetical protein
LQVVEGLHFARSGDQIAAEADQIAIDFGY